MKYADYLKKRGVNSSKDAAASWREDTGQNRTDADASSAQRQGYKQWLGGKGLQSSAGAGAMYRKEQGMGMTDKQRSKFDSPVPRPHMSDGGLKPTEDEMYKRAAEQMKAHSQKKAASPLNRIRAGVRGANQKRP